MRLNPNLIRKTVGEEEYLAGVELYRNGAIRMTEEGPNGYRYSVAGTPKRDVTLGRDMTVRCDCDTCRTAGACRHIVAAWLLVTENGIPETLLRRCAPELSGLMSGLVRDAIPLDADLQMEVTLVQPRQPGQELRIGLRAGQDKLYVIKSIPELISSLENETACPFGKTFAWQPRWISFGENDMHILQVLRAFVDAQNCSPEGIRSAEARLMRLPEVYAVKILSLLHETSFRLMAPDGNVTVCNGIETENVSMTFQVFVTPRGISICGRIPTDMVPLTADCAYVLLNGTPVAVPESQRPLLKMLWEHQYDGRCLFDFPPKDTGHVIGEVLPYLKLHGAVEMSADLQRRLVSVPLKAAVYLDRDGINVLGRVSFRYGSQEINPFSNEAEKVTVERDEKLLLRDADQERSILDVLGKAGFRMHQGAVRLTRKEDIYAFVSGGVRRLQELCEVYLSRDFKRLTPRRPVLGGSIRINGDQLLLALTVDGEPTEDILELMEAISRKNSYFRLKNGEFLDLSDMGEWEEVASNIYESARQDGAELNRDVIVLRSFRTIYLAALLERTGVPVEADESVTETLEAFRHPDIPPVVLGGGASLREYQQRGYEWLVTLDRLHMGGILADHMGLGKTVQIIALLLAIRKPGETSLVVAPTSLTYNWLSEVRRFAPDLSATVLSGAAPQRTQQIRHIREHGDIDLLITSYPLLRRDIILLREIRFRVAVLDEAQHIKNAGSMAAVAARQIQADTRFALTGTPMENGVGELWSVFDYVLPGYLPGYSSFVRRYQEGENAEDLRTRIAPFLTRRLKQDVLKELPEKMETVLVAQMTQEQQQIYQAALLRLRPRIDSILAEKGLGRGRVEILSAITELRQICCHPALVLSDTQAGSGKMELLMEILPEMIANGKRILLFSQFTSMLKILRPSLEEAGYSTMYLDGNTPADERLGLTEQFNHGDTQIFLLSLKAGGAGLNLTGADTVIHYDPWWNPAAEDQATDRAHRIGQTKQVEVIRLVTGESIEEQVVELGQRKKALFDRVITPGESALTALTEQDIRALFS